MVAAEYFRMINSRTVALAFAALLVTGCTTGSSVTPPAQMQQAQSAAHYPADSSAARAILASAGGGATSRAPQRWSGEGDQDDGGWDELRLPALEPCGGGTYAVTCAAWAFGPGGGPTRSAARAAQSLAGGTPPVLNFCRDGGLFPSDLGAPAIAPQLLGATYTFSLSYVGAHAAPIVSFATRWWNINVQGTFTGTSTTASRIAVTPVLTTGASRGWLIFFTWSWPADILLVPYAINEIQLGAGSPPLAIPANGSATLGAFDCLGRRITARTTGAGFGFNPNLSGTTATSPASELNVPVYGGSHPSGYIYLSDDLGARTLDPVTLAPGGGR